MKEYDLRVGDSLGRANCNAKITYAGMPSPSTFCLTSAESGLLYFPVDTDKIDFFPRKIFSSDDKKGILKVFNVTPKKIILTEIVDESNSDYRISRGNGVLRLPETR